MIRTKRDLREYLEQDARANGRSSVRARLFGDEIWKFQRTLRKLEYCCNQRGSKKWLLTPYKVCLKIAYHRLSLRCGFSIPVNTFGKGLAIPHYGTIVVAKKAKVGCFCRIHEGVTIGATNGSDQAAVIGNNVFVGSGAKIIGDVTIADDVAIGANAVVTHSIFEKGTTWGGVPAKKISDCGSRSNLAAFLSDGNEMM